jgi:hypothetical protein
VSYKKDENSSSSSTTPKSISELIFKAEPGRTHSYLPYSNHPPDLAQSRAELYVEDDAMTLSSSHQQVVDMINGERNNSMMTQQQQQNNPSLTVTATPPLDENNSKKLFHPTTTMSLTDKLRYNRQKKQQRSLFHTTSSRRLFLFSGLMTLLGIIAVVIYFCWPRVPKPILKSEKVERMGDPADWGPNQQPWLRATWRLNMTLNNSVNFVTTNINNIELVLVDRDTKKAFAWSRTGPIRLPPYKETLVSLIFRVDYESSSVNDTTFKNLYNACGPQIPTGSPALNLTMQAGIYYAF